MKGDQDSISLALLKAVRSPEITSMPNQSISSSSVEKLQQPSLTHTVGFNSTVGFGSTATSSSVAWRAKVKDQLTRLQSPSRKLRVTSQESVDGRIGVLHRIPRKNPFGARGCNLPPGTVPALPGDRANGRSPEFINTAKRAELTKSRAYLARELNAMDSGTFMDDLTRSNCPVCSTISADTCSFCLKTKLSKVPRMHLKELADRLLRENPSVTTQEMVKMLHDYGRSSDVAASVNERLHFGGYTSSDDSRLYCARHFDAWGDLEDYAASMELEVQEARKMVQQAHDKLAVSASKSSDLREQKQEYEERSVRLARDYRRLEIEHERHLRETKDTVRDMFGKDATSRQLGEDLARENVSLKKENKEMKEQLSELLDKAENVGEGDPATEIAELSTQVADLSQAIARTRLEVRSRDAQIAQLNKELLSPSKQGGLSPKGFPPGASPKNRTGNAAPADSDVSSEGALQIAELRAENKILLEEVELLRKAKTANGGSEALAITTCPHCHAIITGDDDTTLGDALSIGLGAAHEAPLAGVPPTLETIFGDEAPSPEAIEQRISKYPRLVPLVKYSKEHLKHSTNLTKDQCLDLIHDILEKKCVADSRDLEQGNELESMPEFMSNFFLQSYGLQKMADKKMEGFIGALYKYSHVNDRVSLFMTTIGMRHRSLYSRNIGDLIVRALIRAYKGDLLSIKESLDENGVGKCTVPRKRAVEMVIGHRAKSDAPWDWDAPQLFQVATASKIEALLEKIDRLPALESPSPPKAKSGSLVDLDAVLGLILGAYKDWYFEVQIEFINAFNIFDTDNNGLELPEFKVMVKDLCKMDFSEREVCKLWKSMTQTAGASSGLFEDPCVFAVVCCQYSVFPFLERPQPPATKPEPTPKGKSKKSKT